MLFTYRNNPVLKAIKERTLNGIEVSGALQNHDPIENWWKLYAPIFGNKIQKISDSFWEAMTKAEEKLNSDKVLSQTPIASGVLMFREFVYCYSINKDEVSVIYFFCMGVLTGYVYTDKRNEKGFAQLAVTSNKSEGIKQLYADVYLYVNFLKYAPIEVKYVNANKKLKDFSGKYTNQTDLNIEIIDSTWFTTLVRSEGFKVRGHFRLQPYGPNLSERKLIWIGEFQKEGYVRNFKRPIDIDE